MSVPPLVDPTGWVETVNLFADPDREREPVVAVLDDPPIVAVNVRVYVPEPVKVRPEKVANPFTAVRVRVLSTPKDPPAPDAIETVTEVELSEVTVFPLTSWMAITGF